MRIPFVLIDNDGHPMLNQGDNACIQLSKDGGAFVDAKNEAHETGYGCYYIDLTSNELQCQYYINIKVTIDGGQMTLIQYTPDINADDISDAVWENGYRTLTSLSPDKYATRHIPCNCHTATPPPGPACKRWSKCQKQN